MSTLREAAQQALEALEFMADQWGFTNKANRPERWRAIDALRTALAQQEQEPVAWMYEHDGMVHDASNPPIVAFNRWKTPVGEPYTETPLYTHPPRREWVSLTEEEKADIMFPLAAAGSYMDCARVIEQALKERNNG